MMNQKGKHDNSNSRFKTPKIRPNLCNFKGTITVPNTAAAVAAVNNTEKSNI